eukprot:CAMPEP_0180432726 /NCGR_PEP_ID=MMETSP1036_2-20121128/9059_1 /TAXON_ID=632150 /ORGANISM="Azadinium spinosum, Strain 3D9" /LENGTH=75 /DNA_ID=CAMNT_0022438519 /DNA_START=113 /DNA_END=340 /DNA_ORIENTATION=+
MAVVRVHNIPRLTAHHSIKTFVCIHVPEMPSATVAHDFSPHPVLVRPSKDSILDACEEARPTTSAVKLHRRRKQG